MWRAVKSTNDAVATRSLNRMASVSDSGINWQKKKKHRTNKTNTHMSLRNLKGKWPNVSLLRWTSDEFCAFNHGRVLKTLEDVQSSSYCSPLDGVEKIGEQQPKRRRIDSGSCLTPKISKCGLTIVLASTTRTRKLFVFSKDGEKEGSWAEPSVLFMTEKYSILIGYGFLPNWSPWLFVQETFYTSKSYLNIIF